MRLAVLWFSTALAQISYLDRQTFQGINSALCFRLLSAQGAVGCSSYSQISGDESMELIQVEIQQELDEFAASNRKGTLLIPYSLFTAANVDKLQGKLGGLILQHGTPAKYDDQDSIPNKQFGLYAGDSNAHKWNPTGSQGLYTSFEYPIYEIQGFTENSTIALKEAVQFNKQSQDSQIRYGVEFRGRMESSSSTNAQKCLSRGFCDPVGEKSLWSTFDLELEGGKPIILVASKLDSNSLIRDRSMGSSHRISNIVIAGLIFALKNGAMSSLPKNIVFALFGAENFAFSGSQRFVDDISAFSCQNTDLHDNCPLNRGSGCSSPCHRDLNFTKLGFERIESIIEYDSVGHLYDQGEYFIHADDPSFSSTLLSDFAKNFQAPEFNSSAAKEMKVSAVGEGNRLPPSSAMAFLKRKRTIPTIVVSDYKSEYTNRNFRTNMDDKIPDAAIISEVCGLINSHAPVLYRLAGGSTDVEKVQISCDLVADMLFCATQSFQCHLLQNYYPGFSFAETDKTYPSVFSFTAALRTYPFFLSTLMKAGTGITTNDCKKDSDCEKGFECLGKCTKSMTRQHNAFGTGLSFDLEKGIFFVSDETKGTWVESRWDSQGMRIFKMQSWKYDLIPFAIGIVITFISFVVSFKFSLLNWFDSQAKKQS